MKCTIFLSILLQVRSLREEMPSNLATLCYKAVERIMAGAQNMCNSHREQQTGCYYYNVFYINGQW